MSDIDAVLLSDEPCAALDANGVIVAWNAAAADLLGFDSAAACGRDLPSLLFPDDLRRAYGGGLAPFAGRVDRPRGPIGRWSIPAIGGDGRLLIVDVVFEAVDLDTGRGFRAVFHRQRPDGPQMMPPPPLLERIFQHAPEAITVLTSDGRQLFVNVRGLELLGYGRHDGPLDGRLLVHPDDLPLLGELQMTQTDELGRPRTHRIRARSGDGNWRWLEIVATDLRHDPVADGWIIFTRDVTPDAERAQALRTAEARLEAVVANITAASLLEDPGRRGVLWNDAFVDLLGPDAANDLAAGFDAAAKIRAIARRSTDSRAASRDLDQLGVEDGTMTVELVDGRAVEVESLGIRRQDEQLGRLWLFRDVTDRVAAAQQREALLELEQNARQLAEAQAARLRDFDQLRSDFVATVSHELRTPLTSVISATDYLLTCTPEEQPEDLQRFLELIQRNATRLSRLVDDLLVVSRIDTGMLALDERAVDLVALVAATVEELTPSAAERHVTLRFRSSAGPALLGDRLRLQQVVENLLTNAIKFTEPGTPVDIRCTYEPHAWTISVRDHGPGIEPDELELVFTRFYRSRNSVKAGTPGSGLGLTIARGLIAMHGGTLTVRSPTGGGAQFVCVLPVRPASSP